MPFSPYNKYKRNTKQRRRNCTMFFLDLEKAFDKSPKRAGEMGFEEAGCG